jgi:hypothetical protein
MNDLEDDNLRKRTSILLRRRLYPMTQPAIKVENPRPEWKRRVSIHYPSTREVVLKYYA